MGLFSGIMALTAAVTLLIPETKGHSLAEIEKGVLYGESALSDSDIDGSTDGTHDREQHGKQAVEDSKPARESV